MGEVLMGRREWGEDRRMWMRSGTCAWGEGWSVADVYGVER
jgi:hypothetical protein